MVAKWRTGVDVAYGRHKSRDGEHLQTYNSKSFYRFFARMMRYPVPVDTGDFKLCDRAVVNAVCALLRSADAFETSSRGLALLTLLSTMTGTQELPEKQNTCLALFSSQLMQFFFLQ